jgi:hypothetical protein
MMGRLNHDQKQLFYSFRLDEVVPDDHPVREIAAVLDLSWVHSELALYYSRLRQSLISNNHRLLQQNLPPATKVAYSHDLGHLFESALVYFRTAHPHALNANLPDPLGCGIS